MIAFVLGGGGHMGAYEVGQLRALLEHGVRPDVVVGTSIGALNGAAIAADPTLDTAMRLATAWLEIDEDKVFGRSMLAGAANFVRTRTHMHSNRALRTLITSVVGAPVFEDLAVPFHCVAACIERASEQWFSSGPLTDAILASCALPGVLPPVEIGGEHFIDGGVVNSIPVAKAVELGATDIYVLHVGRVERRLEVPRTPLQVALVAFEVARRHRFAADLAALPEGVRVHVLTTGEPARAGGDLSGINYRSFKAVAGRIDRAYRATKDQLAN